MRRADGAGRQDDLAAAARRPHGAVLAPAHACDTTAGELQALDHAAGFEPKILPMQHGFEESACRRPAPAALLVDVEIADALVVAGVEVTRGRNSVLDR